MGETPASISGGLNPCGFPVFSPMLESLAERTGDAGRLPCGRRLHKPPKKQATSWTGFRTAFRVPLESENKVAQSRTFDGLDNGILRAPSSHAQTIAHDPNRLVVAGVDGQAQKVRTVYHLRAISHNLSQLRTGLDRHRMGHGQAGPAGKQGGPAPGGPGGVLSGDATLISAHGPATDESSALPPRPERP